MLKKIFPCSVKLTDYSASAVNVVSSNFCLGPLIKIPFLLSAITGEVLSAPNIIIFLPISPSESEEDPLKSSEILYHDQHF